MNPPNPTLRDLIRTSQDPSVDLRTLRRDLVAAPGVAKRVLNYVRLFYRRVSDLDDPQRAVAILGPRMSGYIAVQHALVEAVDPARFPPSLLDSFWSDCIHRALCARLLAAGIDGLHPDLAFSTALAAEWGVIPLLDRVPQHVTWMRTVRCKVGEERLEAEKALFGRLHSNAFVRLGRAWELPPELLTVIGASHREGIAGLDGEARALCEVVKWADRLGEAITSQSSSAELERWVIEAGFEFDMPHERGWQLIERVLHFTTKVGEAIGVKVAEQPTLDALRKRDDNAGPESLDRGQMIELLNVLQEDNESLRKGLETLEAEVEQLRGVDAVTLLRGHQSFLELLSNEFAGARSDGRAMSLLLLDLDGFSKLNAHHGPSVGDHVLRNVAHLLSRQAGSGDAVGRVGPDTFAIIVAAGERKGRLVAERARAAVEAMVVDVSGSRIRPTATVIGLSLDDVPASAGAEAMFAMAWELMSQTGGNVRNRSVWKGAVGAESRGNRPSLSGLAR